MILPRPNMQDESSLFAESLILGSWRKSGQRIMLCIMDQTLVPSSWRISNLLNIELILEYYDMTPQSTDSATTSIAICRGHNDCVYSSKTSFKCIQPIIFYQLCTLLHIPFLLKRRMLFIYKYVVFRTTCPQTCPEGPPLHILDVSLI